MTPAFDNIARWFLPLAASVYLGIAEEAREEAYKALGTVSTRRTAMRR